MSRVAASRDVTCRVMLGDNASRMAANLEALRMAFRGFHSSPALDSSQVVASLDAALALRCAPPSRASHPPDSRHVAADCPDDT
jgi:hypothetical protein